MRAIVETRSSTTSSRHRLQARNRETEISDVLRVDRWIQVGRGEERGREKMVGGIVCDDYYDVTLVDDAKSHVLR